MRRLVWRRTTNNERPKSIDRNEDLSEKEAVEGGVSGEPHDDEERVQSEKVEGEWCRAKLTLQNEVHELKSHFQSPIEENFAHQYAHLHLTQYDDEEDEATEEVGRKLVDTKGEIEEVVDGIGNEFKVNWKFQ